MTNIRDVKRSDLNHLAPIFVNAYSSDQTGEEWTIQTALPVLQYWYDRSPNDMRILAENENQKITGAFFADIKPWWDGPRMIDGELFVDSNQQSKGIGSILLRTLLNRARENYQATYFETITFMPESIHPLKWYMDIGFEKVDNLTVINGNIEQTLKKLKA